jgi:hypothetical protein
VLSTKSLFSAQNPRITVVMSKEKDGIELRLTNGHIVGVSLKLRSKHSEDVPIMGPRTRMNAVG